MDEAAAYRELIRLGQENHNMFHTAILLHNQTLLAENINMESGLQIGQQLGTLNLGNSNKFSSLHQNYKVSKNVQKEHQFQAMSTGKDF